MDLSFLFDYVNPLILGVCLLVGYVLKEALPKFPNRFIPLSALCLGLIVSIIVNIGGNGITLEVVLGGMISGLASTGLYEMLKNLLKFDKGE